MERKWWIGGVILIVLSIILGAMGAHALKEVYKLSPEQLSSFETGVRYQIYHGIAFLAMPLIYSKLQVSGRGVFFLLLFGVILFSGSIYGLTAGNICHTESFKKILGPITPIGGVLMIIGWVICLFQLLKWRRND
jgi:uncharacterized membrane protein YgdD (TMEM256/DUF423 family)